MRRATADLDNVEVIEADIASMWVGRQFDVIVCVGVIHHTDCPDGTFDNLYRHLKPGAVMVIWTYSSESNGPVRFVVEPLRKLLFRRLPRRALVAGSGADTLTLSVRV